ncbi:hypothetical protein Hanom_Chr13g01210691 [Helianthus anomalus]
MFFFLQKIKDKIICFYLNYYILLLDISLAPVACVMAAHPWLSIKSHPILLDILIYKPPFKRDALKVISFSNVHEEYMIISRY